MVEIRRSLRIRDKSKEQKKRKDLGDAPNRITKPVPKKRTKNDIHHPDDISVSKQGMLEIGDEIPDIILVNQDDREVSLKAAAKEKGILVIFAYPRASTPGCTRQVCGFRDSYDDIKQYALVLGVSADSVNAQEKFHTKQKLPYDLLSDPKRELIGILGAKKTPTSGTIRSYWIFIDGRLKYKNIKVSPELSVAETKEHILQIVKKNSTK